MRSLSFVQVKMNDGFVHNVRGNLNRDAMQTGCGKALRAYAGYETAKSGVGMVSKALYEVVNEPVTCMLCIADSYDDSEKHMTHSVGSWGTVRTTR